MPSPIAHSLMGYCFQEAEKKAERPFGWKTLALFVFFSNLPDIHYLPGLIARDLERFRFPWLHSFGFAAYVGIAVALVLWLFREKNYAFWAWNAFALYAVHVLMDFLCLNANHPEYGLMILYPFSKFTYV